MSVMKLKERLDKMSESQISDVCKNMKIKEGIKEEIKGKKVNTVIINN